MRPAPARAASRDMRKTTARPDIGRTYPLLLFGRGSLVAPGFELPQQKEPGLEPLAFDRPRRYPQRSRDLVLGESTEEPHLDDPPKPFVDHCQSLERLVEREDFIQLHLQRNVAFAQRYARHAAATFCRPSPSREVNEHLTHSA